MSEWAVCEWVDLDGKGRVRYLAPTADQSPLHGIVETLKSEV